MPTPVTGVTGPSGERSTASADIIAEARQRQADRLRAAQAETANPADVVEPARKSDAAEAEAKRHASQPYRVTLAPGTSRLYTEVLDTATGEVIMRIPAGYGSETDAADEDPAIPRDLDGKTGEVQA
ncbi:hypothetical protein J2848_002938 [Azospirillum lipoferum]|uniref:Flagellar protein FlaG n=1 Tax=Azospirillum lipoferum TaxID=193 RepID=A0A5A9GNA7_AZOLI|nr:MULTISPECIES: hypothetical protein [Azospirillum]KAA0595850.1 hypothetical protein FZ942_15835 [Azospirillum lipoferum]MCP1611265.1 hypothetical protein [Azospirillum lipoferum]MDW5537069.1 hypothetical protein [Azospirillum sp. NL1]